ncbi:endo-1,4-beta-xylanase [Phaeacidiphilus oryzae]|uniref:endo-1,4-beta-xylanase n=1 Tax=Phaeacidiphilus oryzae TaxID=348818 RepID=UPI0006909A9C|nr:endo-1,4-beta-xylanase [Phaeacidiphilus oryzae]
MFALPSPSTLSRAARRALAGCAVVAAVAAGGLAGAGSASAAGSAAPAGSAQTTGATAQTLRQLAAADGKYVGTAVDPISYLDTDQTFRQITGSQFSAVTPGNAMKWEVVEPQRGTFDWSGADELVSFAEAHHQLVRGHNLVWDSQLPTWLTGGSFTDAQLKAILRQHIITEVSHFKGRIYAWDVVNEPFNEDGTLKQTIWEKALGPGYIADAIRWAHEADPHAKLYVNDYNIEGVNAKSDAAYAMAKRFKAEGVPLGGIGLESHFILGELPTDIKANMQRFAAIGVDTAVTELDDRILLPATDADLQQQAADFGSVADACLAVRRCVGVTVWGFDDGDSWIPGFFTGYGAATPYDADYQPKPAYYALANAFAAAAGRH